MAKTSEQARQDAVDRAHQITASQGGKFAGSPWRVKHDKVPQPKSPRKRG